MRRVGRQHDNQRLRALARDVVEFIQEIDKSHHMDKRGMKMLRFGALGDLLDGFMQFLELLTGGVKVENMGRQGWIVYRCVGVVFERRVQLYHDSPDARQKSVNAIDAAR